MAPSFDGVNMELTALLMSVSSSFSAAASVRETRASRLVDVDKYFQYNVNNKPVTVTVHRHVTIIIPSRISRLRFIIFFVS